MARDLAITISLDGLDKTKAGLRDVDGAIAKAGATAKETTATTSSFERSLQNITTFATKVASALGLAFTVDAIIGFASNLIETASHLESLSKATGISTDRLQEFGFVGRRVGLDLDSMAELVGQLSRRVALGDDSAVAAIQSLGLSFKTLRSLGPDELFIALVEATSKIADPIAQAGIGAQLFGRQYQAAMRLANEGLREGLDHAKELNAVLDRDSVKALDDFSNHAGALTQSLKVLAAEALTPIVKFFDVASQFTRDHPTFIDPKQEAEFRKLGVALGATTDAAKGLGIAITVSTDALDKLNAAQGGAVTNADLVANRLKALNEEALSPLTIAQQRNIVQLTKWGLAEREIADLVGSNIRAVHAYTQGLEEHRAMLALITDASSRYIHTLDELNAKTLKNLETQTRLRVDAMLAGEAAMAALNDRAVPAASAYDQALHKLSNTLDEIARKEALLPGVTVQGVDVYAAQRGKAMADFDAAIAKIGQSATVMANGEQQAAQGANALAGTVSGATQTMLTFAQGIAFTREQLTAFYDSLATSTFGVPGALPMPRTVGFNTTGIFSRAEGGPVSTGQPYLVGERGPELFVPRNSGSIVPTSGGAITINIYGNVDSERTAQRLADQVAERMYSRLGSQQKRTLSKS